MRKASFSARCPRADPKWACGHDGWRRRRCRHSPPSHRVRPAGWLEDSAYCQPRKRSKTIPRVCRIWRVSANSYSATRAHVRFVARAAIPRDTVVFCINCHYTDSNNRHRARVTQPPAATTWQGVDLQSLVRGGGVHRKSGAGTSGNRGIEHRPIQVPAQRDRRAAEPRRDGTSPHSDRRPSCDLRCTARGWACGSRWPPSGSNIAPFKFGPSVADVPGTGSAVWTEHRPIQTGAELRFPPFAHRAFGCWGTGAVDEAWKTHRRCRLVGVGTASGLRWHPSDRTSPHSISGRATSSDTQATRN